jgi:hypothetical protein
MAKPLNPNEIVTINEIAITNMVEIEALIELLAEKGMIPQVELMEECKKVKRKMGGEVGVYLKRDSSVLGHGVYARFQLGFEPWTVDC